MSEHPVLFYSDDFESNTCSRWRRLQKEKEFHDVTIACDDGQVKAHKFVLSVKSVLFAQLLKMNPNQHPLIYLQGIKYVDFENLLNFIYQGSVNMLQENLNNFLILMKDLQVNGNFEISSDSFKLKEKSEDYRVEQNSSLIENDKREAKSKNQMEAGVDSKTSNIENYNDSKIVTGKENTHGNWNDIDTSIGENQESNHDFLKKLEVTEKNISQVDHTLRNSIISDINVETPKSSSVEKISTKVGFTEDSYYAASEKVRSCKYCKMTFTRYNHMKDHVQRTHEKEGNRINCEICKKEFFKGDFNMHMKARHGKEIRHMCNICEFGCFKKQDFQQHMSAKHNIGDYSCTFCNFKTSFITVIRKHKEGVHSEKRNFTCNECGKGFKEKKGLEKHTENIHGNQKHVCNICGKIFPSKEYIKQHEKIHNADRHLYCTVCGKGYITAQKLKEHTNIHTGDRPYSCPSSKCDKKYTSSSYLVHHKKRCSFQKEMVESRK